MASRTRFVRQIDNVDPGPGPLPDIPAPGTALDTMFPGVSSLIPTSIVSATAPPTLSSTVISASTIASTTKSSKIASATAAARSSSTPSQVAVASHKLSTGILTASIVAPIAFLAILIPIIVFWSLSYRRRLGARNQASQRSSREAMIEKSSTGPAPARPVRTPQRSMAQPQDSELHNSLGLFNFELSAPTTGSTTTPRFSTARALEMRRPPISVIHPDSRPSTRGSGTGPSVDYPRPQSATSIDDRPRTSIYDPPPPYGPTSPGLTSHFAPLERIGTLHRASRSSGVRQGNNAASATASPQRGRPDSNQTLRRLDSYGRVRTRSPSPMSAPSIRSAHHSSNLNGPFSQSNHDRISDVSELSFDADPWREDPVRQPSLISPVDHDANSVTYPHRVF